MRDFDEWISKFRASISGYDYYIDFEKVVKNVEEIKVELNILNTLIGSKNIEEDFEKIMTKCRMLGYTFQADTKSEDLAVIKILLDDVLKYIKHFCNLDTVTDEIQEELSGYISDRVAGQFLFDKRNLGGLAGMVDFDVTPSSVSEGDTSYSVASSGAESGEASYLKRLDNMRNGDDLQLLRFRRIPW